MKEAGIVLIRTSILRRQNIVAQFIATRPILGLCEVAVRWPGAQVPRRWWKQKGIDLKAAREKGGSKGRRRSGGGGGAGVDGLGLGARSRHTGGGPLVAPGRRCPWEQAAPVERSGEGRRINSSVGDLKHDQVVFF